MKLGNGWVIEYTMSLYCPVRGNLIMSYAINNRWGKKRKKNVKEFYRQEVLRVFNER